MGVNAQGSDLGGLTDSGDTAVRPTAPITRPQRSVEEDEDFGTGNPNLVDTRQRAAEHGFVFVKGFPEVPIDPPPAG